MDPVTASLGGISLVSALAFRLGGFIAELQAAGCEFDDIIMHLRLTQETVKRLDPILRDATLPTTLSDEYTRELRRAQNDLEDIAFVIKELTEKLRNRSFFSRVKTKTVLANGELNRLVNRLQFFNQNLSNLIAAHSARVLSIVHSEVRQTTMNSNFQARATMMDMGVRYGQPAVNSLQFEAWGPSQRPRSFSGGGGLGSGGSGLMNAGGYGTGGSTFGGSTYAPNYNSGGGYGGPPQAIGGYGGGGVPWGGSLGGGMQSPPPTYGNSLGVPPQEMRRMTSTRTLADRYANGSILQKDEWA